MCSCVLDCEAAAAHTNAFCTAPAKPRVETVLQWRALENCVTANYSIAELERRWERFDAFAGRSQYRLLELDYKPLSSASANAARTALSNLTLEPSSLQGAAVGETETALFWLRVEYLSTGDRATLYSRVALAPGVYSVLADEWAHRADDQSLLHATRHVIKLFVSNYTTLV